MGSQLDRQWTDGLTDDDFARLPDDWRQRVIDEFLDHPTVLHSPMAQQKISLLDGDESAELRRAAMAARLEYAQASRGARLVRAAGEKILNADAPAVTPDTVWSGDFQTLVDLFQISLYRVNVQAAYFGGGQTRCGGTLVGFLGRTHEQP